MVWTGSEAVVWGGFTASDQQTAVDPAAPRGGAAYDPAIEHWRSIPDAPIPGRSNPSVAWTTSEVIVFGGSIGSTSRLDGAAWNPSTNRWRTIPRSPLTGVEPIGAWLADRLIVVTSTSAAAYDPATDHWTRLPAAPIRVGWRSVAVAAGRLFVVAFGDGATPPVDWAVFDPLTGTWTSGAAPIEPLEAGVVFMGAGGRVVVTDTGHIFDPLTATWSTASKCRDTNPGAVWTGRYLLGITAAWDSVEDRCLQLPPLPLPARWSVGVWTGAEYVTWSGNTGGEGIVTANDGAVFKPDFRLDPAFP